MGTLDPETEELEAVLENRLVLAWVEAARLAADA